MCTTLPRYSCETGSLSELDLLIAASKPQQFPCVCPPHGWGYRCVHGHTRLFKWVLGVGTQVPGGVFSLTEPSSLASPTTF